MQFSRSARKIALLYKMDGIPAWMSLFIGWLCAGFFVLLFHLVYSLHAFGIATKADAHSFEAMAWIFAWNWDFFSPPHAS